MIDFLLSTGIRVGELVPLNIDDIDFSERECVVYGKVRYAMVNQNNVKLSNRKYISLPWLV